MDLKNTLNMMEIPIIFRVFLCLEVLLFAKWNN